MSTISLQSSDGEVFITELSTATWCLTIKDAIASCADDANAVIPLANVSADILRLVLEYCTYHKDDALPVKTEADRERKQSDISEWDERFMKRFCHQTIFDLLEAANYLNVRGLLEMVSEYLADVLRDRTADEIRTVLKEQERIRKEDELSDDESDWSDIE